MSRLLSLDLGERRIGVAYSEGDIISSFDTIEFENRERAISKILELVRLHDFERIIIGLPEGNKSSEDIVRSFALEINKSLDIPIDFENETLTSKEAERILKDSKLDPKSDEYKKEVDRLSAKIILEQYLNK